MREADIEEDSLGDVLEENNHSDDNGNEEENNHSDDNGNEDKGGSDGETEEEASFHSEISDATDREEEEIELELMDKNELIKEHEKRGLKVNKRWCHKRLLQNIQKGKVCSEDEDSSDGESGAIVNFESESTDMDGSSDEDKLDLMDKTELIQEHEKRGLKVDGRWGRKTLLENLKNRL